VKLLRAPAQISPNRSLVALLVLILLAIAGAAAAQELTDSPLLQSAPFFAPAENPVPVAPAVESTLAPLPTSETAPGLQTGATLLPAGQTVAPAPATPYRAAPTTAPHPTTPVGPATSAAPTRDLPVIAPEPGMPSPSLPPSRE